MNMENYIKLHDELMRKWLEKCIASDCKNSFAKDGIIAPEVWFSLSSNEERILFILKEAYVKKSNNEKAHLTESGDGKPIIWDESKWLSHRRCTELCDKNYDCDNCRANGVTFNPLAEWVYGIESAAAGEERQYDKWLGKREHSEESYYSKRDALLCRAAIVNIKKSEGVNGSSNEELYYYAARDRALLIEQIMLIQPTLIVCGGTYGMLRCVFTDLPKMENSSHGACYLDDCKVIATCHPNKRGNTSNKRKYNDVMNLYMSLRKNGK